MALFLAAMAVMALANPALAKNTLSKGSVSPRTGTTSAIFAFRVDSIGKPNPTFINARLTRSGAAPIVIGLTAPTTGITWTKSARVASAGTWTVTFIASTRATAPGGTITVTVAATPRPTPVSTPKPPVATPRPGTPSLTANATSTPSRSAKGSASPAADGATPPATPVAVGGATEPSPSAGSGSSVADDAGRILPAVLLGLLVILGVGGIALLTGRRQAAERPAPEPGGAPDEPPAPAFVRRAAPVGAAEGAADSGRPRQRAAWEVYSSLENRPLGSVDELLPGASAEGAFEADAVSPAESAPQPEACPAGNAGESAGTAEVEADADGGSPDGPVAPDEPAER